MITGETLIKGLFYFLLKGKEGGKYLSRKRVTGKNGKQKWLYDYGKKGKKEKVAKEPGKKKQPVNKLSDRAKYILESSLTQYRNASPEKQKQFIKIVEDNLKQDENGKDKIGFGLDENMVSAGKEFLRIISKEPVSTVEKETSDSWLNDAYKQDLIFGKIPKTMSLKEKGKLWDISNKVANLDVQLNKLRKQSKPKNLKTSEKVKAWQKGINQKIKALGSKRSALMKEGRNLKNPKLVNMEEYFDTSNQKEEDVF